MQNRDKSNKSDMHKHRGEETRGKIKTPKAGRTMYTEKAKKKKDGKTANDTKHTVGSRGETKRRMFWKNQNASHSFIRLKIWRSAVHTYSWGL